MNSTRFFPLLWFYIFLPHLAFMFYFSVCLLHGWMERDSRNRALFGALVSILVQMGFHSDRFCIFLIFFFFFLFVRCICTHIYIFAQPRILVFFETSATRNMNTRHQLLTIKGGGWDFHSALFGPAYFWTKSNFVCFQKILERRKCFLRERCRKNKRKNN